MPPNAILIAKPSIDFNLFLGMCHTAIGYSPSKAVDSSGLQHSDAERFISCLAAIRDPNASAGLNADRTPNLLTCVSFSLLISADERDLLDILEYAAGMPFVSTETVARGVLVAVVTGTLANWRDAVKSGCNPSAEPGVRLCFNKIKVVFDTLGLNVWKDFHSRHLDDHTFLLEDKRHH